MAMPPKVVSFCQKYFLPPVVHRQVIPAAMKLSPMIPDNCARIAPAMESGIMNHLFSFEDLVGIVDEWEAQNAA